MARLKRVLKESVGALLRTVSPNYQLPPPKRSGTSNWPDKPCECDLHLGAFAINDLQDQTRKLLNSSRVTFTDLSSPSKAHFAISKSSIPAFTAALKKSGIPFTRKDLTTSINEYDFPIVKDNVRLTKAVSRTNTEILITPPVKCRSRRLDISDYSVLISTFNDFDGLRLFHSRLAPTRVLDLSLSAPKQTPEDNNPIDVVITYVDGSDPTWTKKFERALADHPTEQHLEKAVNSARYIGHDELRFLLRSLNYYAPYVRTIHIVTDGQTPAWLDVSHPKINLVDHKEIIDAEYLPTFNSDVIESFLWKIPGLSERFLYFNDDVLLMSLSDKDTFFTPNGLPKFFPSVRRIPQIPTKIAQSYTTHAHVKTANALEEHGFPRPIFKFQHAPFAVTKSAFEALETEFKDELHQTRSSPFRSKQCVATISFLYPHFALATGTAITSSINYAYLDLGQSDWKERLTTACARTDLIAACINETGDTAPNSPKNTYILNLLNARFPVKGPWENR